MSNPKIEETKMTNVSCDIATHQGKAIEALCLNFQCKENATLCPKCLIHSHPLLRQQINDIDVIPKQLMDLQQLSFDIQIFQEKVNQMFKELLSKLEQMIIPISQYKVTPNLNNLNQIGLLLRTKPKKQYSILLIKLRPKLECLLTIQIYNKNRWSYKKYQSRNIKICIRKENHQNASFQYFIIIKSRNYSEAVNFFDEIIKIYPNLGKVD